MLEFAVWFLLKNVLWNVCVVTGNKQISLLLRRVTDCVTASPVMTSLVYKILYILIFRCLSNSSYHENYLIIYPSCSMNRIYCLHTMAVLKLVLSMLFKVNLLKIWKGGL
jgi:hypothetical protein